MAMELLLALERILRPESRADGLNVVSGAAESSA